MIFKGSTHLFYLMEQIVTLRLYYVEIGISLTPHTKKRAVLVKQDRRSWVGRIGICLPGFWWTKAEDHKIASRRYSTYCLPIDILIATYALERCNWCANRLTYLSTSTTYYLHM